MIITHSSLECFKCCRRKYQYRYLDKICPKEASNALQFGTEMHEILAQLFEGIEAEQARENAEIEPIESVRDRLCAMIDIANLEPTDRAKLKGLTIGYLNKWYLSDCREYEVIDVEKEFSHEAEYHYKDCEPHVFFVGKVDGILKRKSDGKYFILEHKTASIVDESYVAQKEIDSQTMTYAACIQDVMGIEISGAIHDIITKQKIRLKKGETEEGFCQRLIDDVTDDNFTRIIIEFEPYELRDFTKELNEAVDDAVYCRNFYKCTGSCIGRYGACEYLPLCKAKGKLEGLEELYEVRKAHEEISDETLEGVG